MNSPRRCWSSSRRAAWCGGRRAATGWPPSRASCCSQLLPALSATAAIHHIRSEPLGGIGREGDESHQQRPTPAKQIARESAGRAQGEGRERGGREGRERAGRGQGEGRERAGRGRGEGEGRERAGSGERVGGSGAGMGMEWGAR